MFTGVRPSLDPDLDRGEGETDGRPPGAPGPPSPCISPGAGNLPNFSRTFILLAPYQDPAFSPALNPQFAVRRSESRTAGTSEFVCSFFARAASRIAFMRAISASGISDRSSIRSETSAMR